MREIRNAYNFFSGTPGKYRFRPRWKDNIKVGLK
jgi:hypothetical protein